MDKWAVLLTTNTDSFQWISYDFKSYLYIFVLLKQENDPQKREENTVYYPD